MQGGDNGPLADSAIEIKRKLTALTTRLNGLDRSTVRPIPCQDDSTD